MRPQFLLLGALARSPRSPVMPLDDAPPPYSRLDAPRNQSSSIKPHVLRFIFITTVVSAAIILLSGIILGAVSLDVNKAKKFSVTAGILTLLGVMLLISTVPCCFYFWFKTPRSRDNSNSSCNSSRRSSFDEIDRPAIVSDIYPEEFRRNCEACVRGTCNITHPELPPPYDAPPPYSPADVSGPV